MEMKKISNWLLCPICGNKTRDKIREDTVLKNYPLYCPKCKQETLIEVKDLQLTVIKEPDAQPQSRWMEGKITTVHWLCFIYEIFLGDVSFMSLQKIIIGGFNIVFVGQ